MARKSLPMGVPIKSGGLGTNYLPTVLNTGEHFVNVFNCREYPCDVVYDGHQVASVNPMSFTGFLNNVQQVPYDGTLDVIITEPADLIPCDCRCIAQIAPVNEIMPINMLQHNSSIQIPFPDQNYYLIKFEENDGGVPLTIDLFTTVGGEIIKTVTEDIVVQNNYNFIFYVDEMEMVEILITNNSPFNVYYTQYCFQDVAVIEAGGTTHPIIF